MEDKVIKVRLEGGEQFCKEIEVITEKVQELNSILKEAEERAERLIGNELQAIQSSLEHDDKIKVSCCVQSPILDYKAIRGISQDSTEPVGR